MAILHNDELSQVLGESEYNHRHDTWLWYTLVFFDKNFNENDFPDFGMRDKMARYLQRNTWLADQVPQKRREQLIPKQQLAWITDERRLVEWLTRELQNTTNHSQINFRFNLTGRDFPIALLDVWQRDITEKTSLIKNLEQRWLQHKAHDKRYSWFKDDNQKCSLAYEWLEKNAYLTIFRTPIETYEDLLIFFDNANYTPEKEELYIGKIKKAWTQRKYRASLKNKAQYNFVLSNKTIEALDKISAQYEISRARTIEILVELEAQKGLYIAEKLKNSKLLQGG
ncbi:MULTISPECIES: hypothetical protein [Pseudomonas]|uniref:Uncharacterized protein n=1 Tax=Pseudomonas fortuita TaxID=3233375 RepID=A0ACD4P7R9_9PSED|nr:hypothetical protein [Pseudomonas putida]WAP63128.1 hypothetical protein OZ911_25125 [Pseudomonas putida]